MVYRIYVEKKPGFDHEARALKQEINSFLGIPALTALRVINRYDVENLPRDLFERSITNVFSEPQVDTAYEEFPAHTGRSFITEYLPGQYDQRADSAAQCIQLLAQVERPLVKTATVYLLTGELTDDEEARIRRHVINPVEKRPASADMYETLKETYEIPETVDTLTGFIALPPEALQEFVKNYRLAMDADDLKFCQDYFLSLKRDPTITEIRMLDTYWSDHCRHTTFQTELTDVEIEDESVKKAYERYLSVRKALGRENKPVTLMDVATIGAKALNAEGKLTDLDESDEINACTIKINAKVDGKNQAWLLFFKNETHNHPTEIEPFGGAATCIGGAIRDPLSGRGYVYQAMRVTGAADPTRAIDETIPGKLPQRQLVTTAAAGYSSYGNQIGLATSLVDEIYHDGYQAKRMEIGAVIGAAPQENVRREVPAPGDVVVLLGGRTGRDGCGGATGSSKKHTVESLATCGAEVQKGNAPEERKLQRLFRNPEAAHLIKRCNDFGAGGVSVAIGELADGLVIDLNAVPKKYEGLDGTEIAISESQERMAVVLAPEDLPRFLALASEENLEATPVARVTKEKKLVMNWNGREIVNIDRSFIDLNGAPKYAKAKISAMKKSAPEAPKASAKALLDMVKDLNVCSKRGLVERFDSTNGAMSLLMPYGGKRQLTPSQVMASRISVRGHESETASVMSYGFDPYISEVNPYQGAYLAVVSSVAKLVASGAGRDNVHFSFQEYFQRMSENPGVWGEPLSALLGALDAQLDLGVAAIGGKDSMSGSFEGIHVPPTLVSFAVAVCDGENIRSNEFKRPGAPVALFVPETEENGLPNAKSLLDTFDRVTGLLRSGKAVSASAVGRFGAAECAFKMAIGNGFGFKSVNDAALFTPSIGAIVVEYASDAETENVIGYVTEERIFRLENESMSMDELENAYESKLEDVFPTLTKSNIAAPAVSYEGTNAKCRYQRYDMPKVVIPAFPGTNCEYDTERAFLRAGAKVEIVVIRNQSKEDVEASAMQFAKAIDDAQIIFIPGGFSGGDEPDGSAKFITAFFRNPLVRESTMKLLNERDGLMGGICNGFQALVKLGLIPYGEIRESDECEATLTFNEIGRHQSRIVRTRVASTKSPWLKNAVLGNNYLAPISHGEGRFVAPESLIETLIENGQIATQYADENGSPASVIPHNPNGSVISIEGVTSPDGRVFGKMAHAERVGHNLPLYVNVPGDYDLGMFASAVEYFK
ncbi:MAG: phosphoribosylformylglycinamidine synthase [Clostridia bacterium]|nr:phosphoribosylformylglycinamidine synthase [Clostridia bacterium]